MAEYTARSGPPGLMTLPQELLEDVVEHAGRDAIIQLRLCSREAASKCNRIFIQAYFTHRPVLLSSEQSLETAINIAADPEFGRHLQKMTLIVEEAWAPRNAEGRRWEADQATLRKTDKDVRMLTRIFREVANLGRPIELTLADMQSFTGEDKFTGKWHESDVFLFSPHRCRRPFATMIRALSNQNIPVSTLTLGHDTSTSGMWRDRSWALSLCDISSAHCRVLPTIFDSLQDLRLYASASEKRPLESDHMSASNRAQGFFDAVALLPALEVLELRSLDCGLTLEEYWDYDSGRSVLAKALTRCRFPKLRLLSVQYQDFDVEQLSAFLCQHSNLRGLQLRYARLMQNGQRVKDECEQVEVLKSTTGLKDITFRDPLDSDEDLDLE